MICRYTDKSGRFIDCDVTDIDRPKVDQVMGSRGFSFLAKNPTNKVPLVTFEEFARLLGQSAPGPQLMGPQPGGNVGPVGALAGGQRVGGVVTIPI